MSGVCSINTSKEQSIKEVTSCESSVEEIVALKITKIDDNSAKQVDKFDSSHSSISYVDDLLSEKNKLMKPLVAEGNGKGGDETPTLLSHGWVSLIGRQRVMEDAVTVAQKVVMGDLNRSYDFFAVYDGHGGEMVANACRDRMHKLVAEEVEKGMLMTGGGERDKGLCYWEKVMAACFEKMDKEVMSGGEKVDIGEESVTKIGSTAVVVMVGREEVVVANCGDSRAVLCRGGIAVPLSHDHKPDRPDERERVEAAGGLVVNWHGSRILGILATSRSIGDQYLKPYVISEPEVTVTQRTELDDFIVIASDGLWDAVTNEVACKFVRRYFHGLMKGRFKDKFSGSRAADAAAMLAKLATACGSNDNISIIIVDLKNLSGSA